MTTYLLGRRQVVKSTDSDSVIRGFKSFRPSHFSLFNQELFIAAIKTEKIQKIQKIQKILWPCNGHKESPVWQNLVLSFKIYSIR